MVGNWVTVDKNSEIVLYEYDGNDNISYMGEHYSIEATTDLTDWKVTKFNWSATNKPTKKQYIFASWDDRTSLPWSSI